MIENYDNIDVVAVILAAGKGTRMRSDLPKVLHRISGRPMISYVINACERADIDRICIVVGYGSEKITYELGSGYTYVIQEEQLGTGHALMQAEDVLKDFPGNILVLYGDGPFITCDVLMSLIKEHTRESADGTFLTAVLENTPPFGRIVRDEEGLPERIVEEKDASPEIKKIKEVNTGHYCFRSDKIFPLLKELGNDNSQSEYYLTDLMEIMSERQMRIGTITVSDPKIVFGVNTENDLAEAEKMMSGPGYD